MFTILGRNKELADLEAYDFQDDQTGKVYTVERGSPLFEKYAMLAQGPAPVGEVQADAAPDMSHPAMSPVDPISPPPTLSSPVPPPEPPPDPSEALPEGLAPIPGMSSRGGGGRVSSKRSERNALAREHLLDTATGAPLQTASATTVIHGDPMEARMTAEELRRTKDEHVTGERDRIMGEKMGIAEDEERVASLKVPTEKEIMSQRAISDAQKRLDRTASTVQGLESAYKKAMTRKPNADEIRKDKYNVFAMLAIAADQFGAAWAGRKGGDVANMIAESVEASINAEVADIMNEREGAKQDLIEANNEIKKLGLSKQEHEKALKSLVAERRKLLETEAQNLGMRKKMLTESQQMLAQFEMTSSKSIHDVLSSVSQTTITEAPGAQDKAAADIQSKDLENQKKAQEIAKAETDDSASAGRSQVYGVDGELLGEIDSRVLLDFTNDVETLTNAHATLQRVVEQMQSLGNKFDPKAMTRLRADLTMLSLSKLKTLKLGALDNGSLQAVIKMIDDNIANIASEAWWRDMFLSTGEQQTAAFRDSITTSAKSLYSAHGFRDKPVKFKKSSEKEFK